MTEYADTQTVYRGTWGSFRVLIGGKDVTYFRGVPTEVTGYELTEPYSFGPADFRLPQVTMFEADDWGTGDLAWLYNGAPAILKQVDADGAVVRTIWRGFVSLPSVTSAGVVVHCDGEASGRLSLRTKIPGLFRFRNHVGRYIYTAFTQCNLPLSPYLGDDIGDVMDGRGQAGSMLDYVDSLLAATIGITGTQYTITYRDSHSDYLLALKDTSTVDFTAFLGAHGVDPDISSDLSEQPNTIYGSGVSPEGLVWSNAKFPGLIQGIAPDYPMDDDSSFGEGTTDDDTDSGDGVSVMISKLYGMGYLNRGDRPGGYDADVTEAIAALQDDAGLTESGDMTAATWRALWDLDVTGYSLLDSSSRPLVQASVVKKWLLTSNGSKQSRNPDYDPKVVQVDLAVDHGPSVKKSRARRWSRGVLKRAQNQKNWAGTLTLSSDVHTGDVASTGASDATVMSRLDIVPGMNLKLRNFDGSTKFHVSAVTVNTDLSVTLGIDTQARDAATLGEVIARNIESRERPARQWRRQRRADANMRRVEFSDVAGQLFNKVSCQGNHWTVIPVIAGQAGTVNRIRVQTTNDEAEFVVAITALKISEAYMNQHAGNPFVGTGVSGVYVSDGGSSYESAPSVSFSGGGGSGATATAHVGETDTVTGIVLTDRGSGYTSAPTVSLSGGGGSGATAHTSVTLNDPWTADKVQPLIDDQRALLGAWGDATQPCGYHPRQHTNSQGEITDAPITGLMLEDAGFDYHTFDSPVLYVAIYPDRDTVLKPQRLLWDVLEND